jgi:DNA polymerase-3 subunit gamma/tau
LPASSAPAVSASPAKSSTKVHQEIVPPTALKETPPVSADLSELWVKLVEAVGKASPFTRSYLADAHPVSFEKNLLVIGFDPEFEDHLGLVDNARNHTLLQTKLAELGHSNCQIKFIKAEMPAGKKIELPAPAPAIPTAPSVTAPTAKPVSAAPAEKKSAPQAFSKNDFKNDPLIQKALEIFKGQIVEVRAPVSS